MFQNLHLCKSVLDNLSERKQSENAAQKDQYVVNVTCF